MGSKFIYNRGFLNSVVIDLEEQQIYLVPRAWFLITFFQYKESGLLEEMVYLGKI